MTRPVNPLRLSLDPFCALFDLMIEAHGPMDDLPEELADAIASFYLLYWMHIEEMKGEVHIPDWVFEEADTFKALEELSEDTAWESATMQYLPAIVAGIRELKAADPKMYDYAVRATLDDLKYRIRDIMNKSEADRAAERAAKKPLGWNGLYRWVVEERAARR